MSNTLPPLPEPYEVLELWGQNLNVYDERQMRSYAAAALAAAVAEPVAWRVNVEEFWFHARDRDALMATLELSLGRSLNGAQPEPLYAAPPQREPLREGEVMGAYMDFDRTADRAWTNAEYLVRFGLHISKLTAHGISAPTNAPKEQE